MDKVDQKILDQLALDGGLTSATLGERVGLSPSAAHRRVKALEVGGFITGYRAKLSREALGNPTTVFVSVTLKDESRDTLVRFERALTACPEVREGHLMTGDSDYLLKVAVREGDGYERIHRDVLAALPGVHRLVSQFSIRSVVES